MPSPLRLLLIEDSPRDAELLLAELASAGFSTEHTLVDNEADFRRALGEQPDLIISDYDLPTFNGPLALDILHASGLPIPFILVAGHVGEERAVAVLKRGAADYLLKDRLARLGSAVSQALEHTRLQKEKLRAEANYRSIFKNAVEGIYQTTADGRFLAANPALARIAGYGSPEDMIREITNIGEQVYVDPRERQELGRLLREKGAVRNFETRIRRRNGRIIWISTNLREVRDRQGRLLYYEGTLRDITEQKEAEAARRESEERLRQITDNLSEAVWMADARTGHMLYISKAYETIWGRSRENLYQSPRDWERAVHPEDLATLSPGSLRRQVEKGGEMNFRIIRPDGAIRWLRTRSYPIRNDTGQVYRIVGTAEDITEQRHYEAQFRKAQKMEAIGTLAGGIAHDFNNILGGIMGYGELVRLHIPQDSPARGYMDFLLQGTHRAAALTRQILAFSRQQEQPRQLLQLRHVIAEPLNLLRATLPSTIELSASYHEELPAVLADATQMHQVVVNLCTNAWHAMKGRPGRLEVRLDRIEVEDALAAKVANLRPGPYVRLMVSDSGHGMDAETLERIFEPFFTTKTASEGTGLGLAAVHSIMRNHDGAIQVTSEPGKGTCFSLFFPAQAGPAEETKEASLETPRGNGEHILYVDDEEILRHLGFAILNELGYVVRTSVNAVEALSLIQTDPDHFDLIVTDLTMPGMTGVQLARNLRQMRPDLPVVLTTGDAAGIDAREVVLSEGICEVLIKPHTIYSLGSAVARGLQRGPRHKG